VAKHGKKYRQAVEKVEARPYSLEDAIKLAKDASYAKFDETLEISMRLGVDPKHADQMVRGTVVLPHGLGKTARVLVFASGEKIREAEEAGADHVGGEDVAKKIEGGWLDFDAVVATPDMMRVVGRLGKVLGPRGLMPNPKAGTVTTDVAKAVQEIKAGKVEFRVDKAGNIHTPVGKRSFNEQQLRDNAMALIEAIVRAKPSASKGIYLRSLTVSSTMSPGVPIDAVAVANLFKKATT
jgi:large subunit ribosomal protein L1